MSANNYDGKPVKSNLLDLKQNAHLTLRELRAENPRLAEQLEDRLEARTRQVVTDQFGTGISDTLREILEQIDLPVYGDLETEKLRETTLRAVREFVYGNEQLADNEELRRELVAIEEVDAEAEDVSLAEALLLDVPLFANPEFRPEIEAARLYQLSDATGLTDRTAAVLIDEIGEINAINDDRLVELVESKNLSDDEAKAVGLAVSLFNVLDERPELVAAASDGIGTVRDLAKMDRAEWQSLIERSGTRPPSGIPAEVYAKMLETKFDRLFPSDGLVKRLARVDTDGILQGHSELDALRQRNSGISIIGARNFDALNTDGISGADLDALHQRYDDTVRLSNRYPGMELAAVLDDPSLSEPERMREVVRRVSHVNSFFANNEDVLELDLTANSDDERSLTFGAGTSEADRAMILSTARAYQRTFAVTDHIGDAEALVAGGFASALRMAAMSIDAIAAHTGLAPETVAPYYETAREIAVGVTAHIGTISDVFYGGFNDTAVGNITPSVQGYLNEIPGFADFFGSQDFCRCEHCQSILSPAAYFVDLMCFVDESVTQKHFDGNQGHPLNLENRRPDLWTLELTCENTNTPIPYLVIINEILENAVALDINFAGDFSDRAAVMEAVYKNTLTDQVDSFDQPFHLPFETLRIFLKHFERSLADIGEVAGYDGNNLARLRLELPLEDYQLITQADDSLSFLQSIYGLQFVEAGNAIQKFDVQELLDPTGVSRDELSELIATRFVTENGALTIEIKGEKRTQDSIQNDIERIQGLTRAALDRMHRFVRLWRATGWRIGELDLVLTHVPGGSLNAATVRAVAHLHRLREQMRLDVEDLLALTSTLPQQPIIAALPNKGMQDGEPSAYPQPTAALEQLMVPLFDRLFGQARFFYTGLPAMATSAAPVASSAVGDAVTYVATINGSARPPETVTLTANGTLDAIVADWNSQAQVTQAYRSNALGMASPLGDHLSFRTNEGVGRSTQIEIAADSATLFTAALPEVFLGKDRDRYPQPDTLFLHPALASVPLTGVDPNLHRLLAGTGTDEDQLYQLITGLARPLGIDPNSSSDIEKAFALNLRNLSLLYRHARLARLLKLTIPELFALAALNREIMLAFVDNVDDLEALLRTHAWWEETDWSIAELVQIVRPGVPAVATSATPLDTTTNGDSITYIATIDGAAQPAETIIFADNGTLNNIVADWNSQAQASVAYRSDAMGSASATGDHFSFRITGENIQVTADSAAIFTGASPIDFTGNEYGFPLTGTIVADPDQLAQEIIDQIASAELVLFADTIFAFLDEITETESRAIVTHAENNGIVETVDAEGRLRLRAAFDPNAALSLPPGIDPALEPRLRELLLGYYSEAVLLSILPGRMSIAPDNAAELVRLLGEDLNDSDYFREVRGDFTPPDRLAALIARLQPLGTLFAKEDIFNAENLAFVGSQGALFGIENFDRISLDSVRRVELFRTLLMPWRDQEDSPDLRAALLAFDPVARFANADQEALAALLECDAARLNSLQENLSLSTTPFEVLEELLRALPLSQHLGVGGAFLILVGSTNYDDLENASAAIRAAFRSWYEDDAEYEEQVEPFIDLLLSRQRDGLAAYLIHSGAPQFDEINDLYHYFLLDVELEGCARTSRVAAAIASVQLYVQRITMNLERTPHGAADEVHVSPKDIDSNEWEWRKNYRVWEANRKIFLHPENWLEPELRDDKTPLFEALEEELLSKEITEEAVLDAYGRYLRGFDEVAHLKIVGSYHEQGKRRDILHLFGATSDDPPVYYYRRVEDARIGVLNSGRATQWGTWKLIDVQIPVRKVAPIVHNGQLYVFWIRYTTKPLTKFENGNSKFEGYEHRAFVEFSKRRLDGSWTSPQPIELNRKPFVKRGEGVIRETFWRKGPQNELQPLYDDKVHEEPIDNYTLTGFAWDQVFPESRRGRLYLRAANFQMWSALDFYRRQLRPRFGVYDEVPWLQPYLAKLNKRSTEYKSIMQKFPKRMVWLSGSFSQGSTRKLHGSTIGVLPAFEAYTLASLVLEFDRYKGYRIAGQERTNWSQKVHSEVAKTVTINQIGIVPSNVEMDVVNGSVGDTFIQTEQHILYLQHNARRDCRYHLRRLNTTVSEDIASTLFNKGLEALLATNNQLKLAEAPTNVIPYANKIIDATKSGTLDFNGAMGVYLREIFFHIPFLIANHLNSQGQYAEAQRWYHFIFDPTAAEAIENLPAGLSPEERRRRELDRNWRYREFRELSLASLRNQLTNKNAIRAYQRNPFNPHAIARLRLGAYQKAIVMKYVDNLLDWGDHLFALAFSALNPEYLREATTLYVMAQEILGKRPARLGDCGEGAVQPKTFPRIKDSLSDDSNFLMEVEYEIVLRERINPLGEVTLASYITIGSACARIGTDEYAGVAPVVSDSFLAAPPSESPDLPILGAELAVDVLTANELAPVEEREITANLTFADTLVLNLPDIDEATTVAGIETDFENPEADWTPGFGRSVVRVISPIFCVPGNERMLTYWDRVEDRLFKIRNCMDIEGVVRRLPLFAPPIDLDLLLRARAAGLGLDDILSATGGSLPPYRFRYLLEKARAFAATVQGFGTSLLSAFEKRDAEELARLRNLQQKNILKLTTEVRQNDLRIAQENVEIVRRRQAAAKSRYDYYDNLISTGLTTAEGIQSLARIAGAVYREAASASDVTAAIAHLVPETGSPFAMKYGGLQLGNSAEVWGKVYRNRADVADIVATISGIVANFERREQGWEYQRDLAENDLGVIERELMTAELREDITRRSLELHEKAQEQHDEVMEYYDDKFSNLGLYTYLSRSLQQLFREAYSNALALAQLAEQAYHFERPQDTTFYIGGEWDASKAGLLAGERLSLNLQRMDRRFIETNDRRYEINQSFSLAQIDPEALIDFKETGICEFSIPEFYFDMFYPGQYHRWIRGVRLTIPCITGPYANVSAKLTLQRSHIRSEPVPGEANLRELPPTRTISVATSTAQGDAGVFELNFRDERYMPFEGAGAISEWKLELPRRFRPFDYQSINDVILNLSYTAEDDSGLRQSVEVQNGVLENFLSNNTLTRVFSLRQEFSNAFNRLIQAVEGTPVTIDITERHFPLFLQGQVLSVSEADLILAVAENQPVDNVSIRVNGASAAGFAIGMDYSGLPFTGIDAAFAAGLKQQHTITANDVGALVIGNGVGAPRFDSEKIRDILLVIKYSL